MLVSIIWIRNRLISPLLRAFLLLPILDASLDGCADLHEAEWVDQQAAVAGDLVSRRSPDDILAFNRNDCTV